MDSRRVGAQDNHMQPQSNDTIVSQLAEQDKVPWYCKPNLRLLYLLMLPTCIGVEMTSGFDASMVNGLQAIPSWLDYYDHPRSASLGLMSAMYSLGSVGALPFVSSIVDKFGRRFPILLGGTISIIGAILQGSASTFTMFIFARFILGSANVFCVVAASSMIGELSHPKERAVMGCLFNTSYALGAVTAAGVTLTTFAMTNNWGWRIPSFVQMVPSLLQVSFIFFLPESPRWLVSQGRKTEAYAILVKYHGEGDENSDFVKAEYSQIEQTLEAELTVAKISQKDVFSTPGMRKRVIVAAFLALFTQWCGIGLMSQYLSPVLDSIGVRDNRTKHIINLSRVSWSFVNGTIFSFLVPRYPRRSTFLVCTITVFVLFTAWTIATAEYSFNQSKVSAHLVIVLIFLYSPAYNLGFNALPYAFLVELFPFHVRARGIALYQWWLRGAGFFDQFVAPIGIDTAGWRWYIIYCVWNAFQVVFVYLMFPETSGRTLEELTFLYENEQDTYRSAEVEILREEGGCETYGTMEAGPRRTGHVPA
ncbi:general substrate transporter [Chiua virens]|nr:general substrate transporter [Chiua virens]